MTTTSDPFDRQIELEEEMLGRGILRFRKEIASATERGEMTSTPAVRQLLQRAIDPMSAGVTAYLKDTLESGRRGPRPAAALAMQDINPDVMGFITAKAVLDKISAGAAFTSTAMSVGRAIEAEARLATFQEAEPKLYRLVREEAISRSRDRRHRTMIIDFAMNRVGIEWDEWPAATRLQVGTKMVSIMAQETGLVEVILEQAGKNRTVYMIRPTQQLLEWINDRNTSSEVMWPVYMPMIIKPRRWTGPYGGGYYSQTLRKSVPIPFVKRSRSNYLDELRNRPDQMEPIYEAINAVQETPWSINAKVLNVAGELWDRGTDTKVLPERDAREIAPCPLPSALKKEDMTVEQQEQLRDWKVYARDTHEYNAKLVSKRIQTARILAAAARFATEDAIYFPHQVDFRGRAYSMTASSISPQGSDLSKGLLTFADGVPIDDAQAAGWLAIHVANSFGEDKLALESRIDWAFENADVIKAVAEDPLENFWWSDADAPWQFLAACFEFAAFLTEGYGYVSHLPVAMDATCSGLQHFSAMTRDEVGGASVNLTPAEVRRDIYQDVADRVTSLLAEVSAFKEEERPIATALLKWMDTGVPRKATKRTVMVVPYSGTFDACRKYTQEWMEDAGAREVFDKGDFIKATALLARCIWKAVDEVVVGSREVMRWLQDLARIAAKTNLPLVWTAPSGFPVFMGYERMRERRVETRLGDRVMRATVYEGLGGIDQHKQTNAVAPNFVHACDASHLVDTVNLCDANGIHSFAMIHDSFGTHAGNSALLATCIRQAFVDMYEREDVLRAFSAEIERVSGGDLPEPPAYGSLDISSVRDSDFFFS